MKTLYVSDLDGTLLGADKKLSDFTVQTLKGLMDRGMLFTVATARTPATLLPILKGFSFTVPVVVMNGVFVFDLRTREYLVSNLIAPDAVCRIRDVLLRAKTHAFVYGRRPGGHLTVYYGDIESNSERIFYNDRSQNEFKKFVYSPHFDFDPAGEIVYFTMNDTWTRLQPVHEQISRIRGVSSVLYRDVYLEGCWWLEVFSDRADKGNGVAYLKEYTGADRVVAFGDNQNDAGMLGAADYACAVANASEQVQALCDEVIEANTQDGVARRLIKLYGDF